MKCNPNCVYYPQLPDRTIKEYIDENGLKHKECVYLCCYDDHRILYFDEDCPNYKSI